MKLLPLVIVWAVLATGVIVLAVYRMRIAGRTDELLHVDDAEAGMIARQSVTAQKLETIDRWGKALTVVTVLYGLVLAGVYVWNVWQESASANL